MNETLMIMELFRSELFYIFVKNENSLWWNRINGEFTVKSAWDLSSLEDIECLGITEGIIGKVEHSSVYEPRLIIIKESAPVGQIYVQHTIHKIKSICFLNLGTANTEIDLVPCPKHGPVGHVSADEMRSGMRKTSTRLFENSPFLNKTFGVVKSAGHTLKSTTQHAATQVKQSVNKRRDPKVAERFEKRVNDELHKIFDDTDSFYYSRTLDITNTLQRQYANEQKMVAENPAIDRNDIANWWKYVDDRFFWNKYMLKDIIDMGSPECNPWILPIIQGYIQLMQCAVDMSDISGHLNTESLAGTNSSCDEVFTIGVISRRSRYQAGTRYNRRGIEPGGKVANYVETEQIVSIVCTDSVHRASFVQIRGSVPIYWSQPGYKARPPPRLDRTEEESHEAFKKHLSEELSLYNQICIVNLVEQTGREKVIYDAYSSHVLKYDNSNLIYTTFDFHEYCRGMHYENVSILISALADVIDDMKFCWRDDRGIICSQLGTFRVNCIDCLDRTNVVQTAIAKSVLEIQLARLGLASPGAPTPPALRTAFLTMWADNGDVISRQYAGTNALKGDYTRTGERKLTGIMKDGMNSASRYYLSTFKDAVRQIAIDMMTGESKAIPEDVLRQANQTGTDSPIPGSEHTLESEEDTQAMAMHVKALIDDCKKLLVCDSVTVLGSWGLIDADPNTGDPLETDMDSVLILTADSYYVADYDDQTDRVVAFQTIPLQDVTLLEFGLPDASNQTFNMLKTNFSVGKKPTKPATTPEAPYCIRINYRVNNVDGFFHMFRSTNLRFFNNMAVVIKTKEEIMESLRSICESFIVARDISNLPALPFMDGVKLERKKSKVHPNISSVTGRTSRNSLYLDLSKLPTITRNVSETQLVADIRSVGSKALNNMSEQFSKLNKLTSLNSRSKPSLHLKLDSQERPKKTFTLGQNRTNTDSLRSTKKKGSLSDGMSSDYSSDDENRTNIFEPTLDNFEHLQHYIGNTDSKNSLSKKDAQDADAYLMENPLYVSQTTHSSEATSSTNDFTSSLGNFSDNQSNVASLDSNIVSCSTPQLKAKHNPFNTVQYVRDSAGSLDGNNRSSTPEITIESETSNRRAVPPNNLKQVQKFSHSSCEMNVPLKSGSQDERPIDLPDGTYHVRSNSEHHIFLNISQSQSESALKQLTNVTSPVTSVTKELVLSPFSKIAKGMQHLGANLDPRRIKVSPTVKQPNEQRDEEHRQLQEKWKDCKTKLIAL